jgi:hypothetical protein
MPNATCPSEALHYAHCNPCPEKAQYTDNNPPRHKEIAEPELRSPQQRERVHAKKAFFISLALRQASCVLAAAIEGGQSRKLADRFFALLLEMRAAAG